MTSHPPRSPDARAGSVNPPATVVPSRLTWLLWLLLTTALVPVCQAQGLWLLGLGAMVLAALGIRWTLRHGRPVIGSTVSTAIAVVLGILAILVSIDAGLIGVYAVADWLIAVAVLKCWQLAGSRDCAHVVIISALLLLVGAMVSGQLSNGISLILALLIAPTALVHWHLLAEGERLAALTGDGTAARPDHQAGRMRGLAVGAAAVCVAAGFVIFVAFPRLRTPLQPNVQTAARGITGFSAESQLNEIRQLQRSDRVYMRVRLTVGGQSIGSQDNLSYFRAMTYSDYNGYGWEDRGDHRILACSISNDAALTYFRKPRQPDPQGAIEQEYWIEAGPPPRLFTLAQSVPVAIGSQEVSDVRWNTNDDTLIPPNRLPATVHYKLLSVPPYMLDDPQVAPPQPRPSSTAPASSPRRRWRTPRGPVVQREVVELARSLAAEVTGNADESGQDPATHEQIVERFLRHLGQPQFTYALEGFGRGGYGALERFLFQTRRGYCEYFATALVVMCQCVGIPARYVTGFHGGQYNDVGQFYAVRDSDAHSWVEIWLPEVGWRTFDPTPPDTTHSQGSSLRRRLAGVLDYLQFQWSSWVVAYDILHRQRLLGTFGDWLQQPTFQKEQQAWMRFLWTCQQLLKGPETLSALGKVLYWFGLLGVLSLSGYLLVQLAREVYGRLRRHRQSHGARPADVRFYRPVVAALARRGFVRRRAETPREFALRVEQAVPQVQGLLVALIECYYAARFGGGNPVEAGQRLGEQVLAGLDNGAATRTHTRDKATPSARH